MGPRRTKGKLEEKQIGDGEAKMGKYSQGTPVRRGFRSLAAAA